MVGGEAGQGVQPVGFLLAKALAHGGYQVFGDQDFDGFILGWPGCRAVLGPRRSLVYLHHLDELPPVHPAPFCRRALWRLLYH